MNFHYETINKSIQSLNKNMVNVMEKMLELIDEHKLVNDDLLKKTRNLSDGLSCEEFILHLEAKSRTILELIDNVENGIQYQIEEYIDDDKQEIELTEIESNVSTLYSLTQMDEEKAKYLNNGFEITRNNLELNSELMQLINSYLLIILELKSILEVLTEIQR